MGRAKFEVISVNYNTPDLLERMIESFRQFEEYHILIIDGSDREPYISQTRAVCEKYPKLRLKQLGYNIHHGRGLDYGIRQSSYDYCLCCDTDVELIDNSIFDYFDYRYKFIGFGEKVKANGKPASNRETALNYLHPRFLLLDRKYYLQNAKNFKFIHHGAPAIEIMKYLHKSALRDELGLCLSEKGLYREKFFKTEGRGTVDRFDYNLKKYSLKKIFKQIMIKTGLRKHY